MLSNKTILVATVLAALVIAVPAQAKTVTFAGYNWDVRSGQGGPGPNHWSDANVWVDANGALHLRLNQQNGIWQCAELYLNQRLGFGTYEWDVTGPIDQLDPNIVLGLFNYPTPDVGPDGTNEIDIEFSHWGDASYPIGNYTVWPPALGPRSATRSFSFSLTNDRTTQRFVWTPSGIAFRSLNGFTSGNSPSFGHWAYKPSNPAVHVPQQALPVHMNLWLYAGQAPTDGKAVNIVINNFKFTPY